VIGHGVAGAREIDDDIAAPHLKLNISQTALHPKI
jgi:hypothetical protein